MSRTDTLGKDKSWYHNSWWDTWWPRKDLSNFMALSSSSSSFLWSSQMRRMDLADLVLQHVLLLPLLIISWEPDEEDGCVAILDLFTIHLLLLLLAGHVDLDVVLWTSRFRTRSNFSHNLTTTMLAVLVHIRWVSDPVSIWRWRWICSCPPFPGQSWLWCCCRWQQGGSTRGPPPPPPPPPRRSWCWWCWCCQPRPASAPTPSLPSCASFACSGTRPSPARSWLQLLSNSESIRIFCHHVIDNYSYNYNNKVYNSSIFNISSSLTSLSSSSSLSRAGLKRLLRLSLVQLWLWCHFQPPGDVSAQWRAPHTKD